MKRTRKTKVSSACDTMPSVNINHLPDEILRHIFRYLSPVHLGQVARVSSRWNRLVRDHTVWRGKTFLSDCGVVVCSVVDIARSLPVLRALSIWKYSRIGFNVSKNLKVHIEVPDTRDKNVTELISPVRTDFLCIEFSLLDEKSQNCLLVSTSFLTMLQVTACPDALRGRVVKAKLKALSDVLSRNSMRNLRAVKIETNNLVSKQSVQTDLLSAVSMCPVQVFSLNARCTLLWDRVKEFADLSFLKLVNCTVHNISFLDLCPNLLTLVLDNCSPLGIQKLSKKSKLTLLSLARLSVTPEHLEIWREACPDLTKILIKDCPNIVNSPFVDIVPTFIMPKLNVGSKVSSFLDRFL